MPRVPLRVLGLMCGVKRPKVGYGRLEETEGNLRGIKSSPEVFPQISQDFKFFLIKIGMNQI